MRSPAKPSPGCRDGGSGQVTGTFDMDDMMVEMTGAYTGSTTCTGPFDHGQMTMTKR